ncbi:unnamed protein product [Didymodactylos carnosus]|uniref:Uncharacterized protein n=1 Tax=Didymodactylos carnosus TaxID=1234261 RepID=A0A814F8L3_9BILA|nr:unnamed protein product [Didymodactylos carnosus]CAF3749414.1 unnamed protein product [Didymodactylos carnosus]
MSQYYIRQYGPLIPNINQFINVRTLIIHYPSSDQLKQIEPTIFKYLTCLCIQYSPCVSKQYEHLFSRQFYLLKKCHLSYINEMITIITSTSNIQSLTISRCNKNDLYLIIKYLGQLKYLSVGLIEDATLATITLNHLPSIISRKLTTLKLVIDQYQMHFYEFEYIASWVPNLNYLFIKSCYNEHLDFNRWQHVLSAKLLKLLQFDCYFNIDTKPIIIPDINQIRQNPLFTEIKCDDSGEGICFYTNKNAIPKFYGW